MDRQMQWTAFTVMGLALLAAVGISMARGGDANQKYGLSALGQEKLGYSISLHHYVDKTHFYKSTPNGQERLGQKVVLEHFVDETQGAVQEEKGYQLAVNTAWDRIHAMEQEQMGMQYMLQHQAKRLTSS